MTGLFVVLGGFDVCVIGVYCGLWIVIVAGCGGVWVFGFGVRHGDIGGGFAS